MQKSIYIGEGEDEEYWNRLEDIAEKERRSVSFIVKKLIRDYVDRRDDDGE